MEEKGSKRVHTSQTWQTFALEYFDATTFSATKALQSQLPQENNSNPFRRINQLPYKDPALKFLFQKFTSFENYSQNTMED